MAFAISEFRSKGLAKGGARPKLFQAQMINNPAGIPTNGEGGWSFVCKIASIPASTIGAIEVPYFGRQVKIPGNRTFDNLSVTIINDEGFGVRNSIESWMADMNSHQGNQQWAQANDLLGIMSITQYSKDRVVIGEGEWEFVNIFPTSLGEIALDWGSNDAIEEYTIEFAYDYWTHGTNTK